MSALKQSAVRQAILIAVALCCCFSARAESAEVLDFYTGNQLFGFCRGGSDACVGYILGIAAARSGEEFCFPRGVTGQQVVDVTKVWLRSHPEGRHLPGNLLVTQALKEKFPLQLVRFV